VKEDGWVAGRSVKYTALKLKEKGVLISADVNEAQYVELCCCSCCCCCIVPCLGSAFVFVFVSVVYSSPFAFAVISINFTHFSFFFFPPFSSFSPFPPPLSLKAEVGVDRDYCAGRAGRV
jgi:hypothetical protein